MEGLFHLVMKKRRLRQPLKKRLRKKTKMVGNLMLMMKKYLNLPPSMTLRTLPRKSILRMELTGLLRLMEIL